MSNYIIINGELYHHGIKGQRWGVRRYQNKDGSLTPKGRARLAKEDAKFTKRHGKKAEIAEQKRSEYIKSQERSLKDWKRNLEEDERIAKTNIDDIDFDKVATDRIAEQMDLLKAEYDDGASTKKPTMQDAIESFYISDMGIYPPKNATMKDVASLIKADTIIQKQNNVYEFLIQQDKEFIASIEDKIKRIKDIPLKEIYNNRFNLYSYMYD